MTDKILFSNNGRATISVAISDSATSITTSGSTSLNAPGTNEVEYLTIIPLGSDGYLDKSSIEIVKCTANVANVLTVVRAQEGTIAKAWPVGSIIYANNTAGILAQFAQGLDFTGNTTGVNAVELQSGRDSADRVAAGTEAVCVGYNNKATNGVAIGRDNNSNGVSIGLSNLDASGVAIGNTNSISSTRGIGIGTSNKAPTTDRTSGLETIQIGHYTRNAIENGTKIGGVAIMTLPEWPAGFDNAGDVTDLRFMTGYEITIFSHPVGIGNGPAWPTSTLVDHGEVIVEGSYSYFAYSFPTDYWSSQTTGTVEPTWPTTPQDSVQDVANLDWICMDPTEVVYLLPNYTRFIPIEVGFITDENSGSVTAAPVLQFGDATGTPSSWLSPVAFNYLDGANKRQAMKVNPDPTASKILVAGASTLGTGNITGRFFWKGVVMEGMTS